MPFQFIDRILACSDCHGEFVFTAGEQLFFSEKQFKNDPKRCKPCKSRRSGFAAAINGSGPAAAGISRTETRTECSDCGVETTVPFKPTQGRPVLCRQCFQSKAGSINGPSPLSRIAHPFQPAARSVESILLPHEATLELSVPGNSGANTVGRALTISALTELSTNQSGKTLTPDAALLAASSMAAASSRSSVASAADLASISDLAQPPPPTRMEGLRLLAIPVQLVSDLENGSSITLGKQPSGKQSLSSESMISVAEPQEA